MSIIEKFLASGLAFVLASLLFNGLFFVTLGQAYINKMALILGGI